MKGNDFSIYIGDDLIGFAKDVGEDQPWRRGKFEATPTFEKYRALFVTEEQLANIQKWDERERHLIGIYNLGLKLESPTKGVIKPYPIAQKMSGGLTIFHIRGDMVSWRPT
jgi:hypothetical protein